MTDFIEPLTVYREASGEPFLGKLAVGWVLVNRASDKSRRWPSTPADVAMQARRASSGKLVWQFSAHTPGDANYRRWPKDGTVWSECLSAWHGAVSGAIPDPTHGANHYHSISLNVDAIARAWGLTLAQLQAAETARIGNHVFYKL